MKNKNIFIIVMLILIVVTFINPSTQKQAVADIEGQPCIEDEDCPCWGKYNVTQFSSTLPEDNATAYGMGLASCVDGFCDVTYCVDVKPVGEWVRDNPWKYLRTNPVMLIFIILLIVGAAMWPKV